MTEVRVNTLRLEVRAPAARGGDPRAAAERLARRVLEACGEELDRRYPGNLILVRRMPIRWSLLGGDLPSSDQVGRRAQRLADAIEARVREGVGASADGLDVALFDDEAHALAACWRDVAHGRVAWYHEIVSARGGRAATSETDAPLVLAALARLHDDGDLVAVVGALPTHRLDAMCGVLGIEVSSLAIGDPDVGARIGPRPDASAPEDPDRGSDESADAGLAALVAFARSLPAAQPAQARAIMTYTHAHSLFGSSIAADLVRATLARALARTGPVSSTVAPSSSPSAIPGEPSPLVGYPSAGRLLAESATTTRFGGVFYLLNLALELDLGDILWRVCLPEGVVLAHAVTWLLGPGAADDDPAPWLFGGVSAGAPMPAVSEEQQEEVSLDLLAALAGALPRRGLAARPAARLSLVDLSSGRLLVATAQESRHVLFAHPAPTPAAAAAGIQGFLRAWPRAATAIHASAVLAELADDARIRSTGTPDEPIPLHLGPKSSLPEAALLAQVSGSLAHAFAARTAVATGADPASLVARHLGRPASVLSDADSLTIRFRMADIDLDARRAGLDRDPGWVPWLGRRVRIAFADDESAQATPSRPA